MAIVTLHYQTHPIITDSMPVDQVLYTIRHFISNPGFTSSLNADQEISLRGIITRYPDNPQSVADAVSSQLTHAIQRLLPSLQLNVSVTLEFLDKNNYKLILNVQDGLNNPFIPSGTIEVVEDKIKFTYEGA